MSNLIDLLEQHENHKDKNKVWGLAIQGGGMRAAYSAGAMATLIEYGFQETFDHVVGSSAGALNGAYFLTAQADSTHSYTDDLTNKNFVNLTRKDKKVDIDYCVDVVLKQKRPLNIKNLERSPTNLHIVLTDAKTGKQFVISNHKKFIEIYEEFRATAAIPILYDRKIVIDGKSYVDGGVANLIPVDYAVKLGCTDIVVVMTRQISSYQFKRFHTRLADKITRLFAQNQSESVKKILPTDEKRLKHNLKLLISPPHGVNLYILQPSNEEIYVTKATIDKDKITKLVELGTRDMDEMLHTIVQV